MEVRIKGIKLVSCVYDGSGYAQGVRNWLTGLYKFGVPMFIQPVSFERDRPELNELLEINDQKLTMHELLDGLSRTQRPCDINFVRLSPEVAVNFLDPDMINICSCAWETTKLDDHWVECCNKFDAIFVESEWLVEVFTSSGVTVPIYCVPNMVDTSKYKMKTEPNLDKPYAFYSIQQWIERKNGLGLLKSYFNAFSAEDNVILILKTYLARTGVNVNHQEKIKEDIDTLKRSLNLNKNYPPVYLVTEKLTTDAIVNMHEQCDCYVLLDRGEGFGLPYMDAAAAANPIIRTDFGGTGEFLNSNNSYGVKCQPTFVCNMEWSNFYRGDQLWAEPNLVHASSLMRYVYDNKEEAFSKGRQARADMEEKFNIDVITKRLLSAITDVVATKRGLK